MMVESVLGNLVSWVWFPSTSVQRTDQFLPLPTYLFVKQMGLCRWVTVADRRKIKDWKFEFKSGTKTFNLSSSSSSIISKRSLNAKFSNKGQPLANFIAKFSFGIRHNHLYFEIAASISSILNCTFTLLYFSILNCLQHGQHITCQIVCNMVSTIIKWSNVHQIIH